MGIFNTLFGQNDTTSFYKLYNKMRSWKEAKVFPNEYNLPKEISFPKDFWDRIVKIQKHTLQDGKERAISIYWADGDLVVSPITTGSDNSVTTKGNISVKYSPHPTRKDYYRKKVILNSSIYKQSDIYIKKIPKKIEVSYLFNMHTHPQHKDERGNTHYNFFSVQDIKSLLKSNVSITGLITDKLWILIRTKLTPNNIDKLQEGNISIENLINNQHIGVYCGEFYKKVIRQLPTTTTRATSTTS